MTHAWWPIALIVASNVLYQVCAKAIPKNLNPMAALTVTYCTAAVCCLLLFPLFRPDASLLAEYRKLGFAPVVLGFSVVGLEAGFIYAYKVGWPVSTASIVQSAFLALALLVLGAAVYNEPLNARKLLGIVCCMIGLYFLNTR